VCVCVYLGSQWAAKLLIRFPQNLVQ